MSTQEFEKYAELLASFCVNVQEGQAILVKSTYLAEPLLQPLQTAILKRGGIPEFQLAFEKQTALFYEAASDEQVTTLSPLDRRSIDDYAARIIIDAPFDVRETRDVAPARLSLRQKAMGPQKTERLKRGAEGTFTWCLCKYPTVALANEAGMSQEDYAAFVFNGCFLFEDDPVAAWKALSTKQQKITDVLNSCSEFAYKGPNIDVSFSTKGRKWINSDGKRNMPSGEMFTSPVEDSVEGTVRFTYPVVYLGNEISGVEFEIHKGEIVKATCDSGKALLDTLLETPGARRFGEVAIGNNDNITVFTKSTLFDEKIGGSVHMAIGSSYPETGGVNQSSVHMDLITDMKVNAEIVADGTQIYKNGRFTLDL